MDKTKKLLDEATARQRWEPIGFYIYNSEGRYRGAEWAQTPEQATAILPEVERAVAEGRQVRIADTSDRMLFHAQGGRVIWDGAGLNRVLERMRTDRLQKPRELANLPKHKP